MKFLQDSLATAKHRGGGEIRISLLEPRRRRGETEETAVANNLRDRLVTRSW